jgi:hypothetical protein
MKDYYDVIVIGSGPGGLGTCFHLSDNSKKSILIVDKLTYSSGGLKNDVKSNWTFPIGFPKEYWSEEQANTYLKEAEKYLKPTFLPMQDLESYINRAKKFNTELYVIRQCHVGTDKSSELIDGLIKTLLNRGVDVQLNKEVIEVNHASKHVVFKNGEVIKYGDLVLSVGRAGAIWLQDLMHQLNTKFIDNIVDIGVRIELKEENYKIVKDYYDPKFWLPDQCRTFCTNSGRSGVVREKYDGYFSVNGHALSDDKKSNGLVNFALLKTIGPLTEPLESGTKYAQILGKAAMSIGGGKPLMQRIGDIRSGRRSKQSTFNSDLYDFEPTLKSCTPGDLSLVMPAKIFKSLWSSIKILDSICPGVMDPSTILYYPEIKTYSNKPVFLDGNFKISDNIYACGDGAGVSRGITGAWASGCRVSIGILNKQ